MSVDGQWRDDVGSDDASARALLGLATAATAAWARELRSAALRRFELGASFDSPWPRPNATAALAAATVLTASPHSRAARSLLERCASRLGSVPGDRAWPWPEPRLAWANALLVEARIAAGVALPDPALLAEGLRLLEWLVAVETQAGHFSFTPTHGWGPGEPRPGFDQQPIEAGAMADACARAFTVTGDRAWSELALRAATWFVGANDAGIPLLDPATDGCRDGLERDSCNENQGAESTIAMIGALQQARRLRSGQAAARSAATISRPETVAAPTQRSAAP